MKRKNFLHSMIGLGAAAPASVSSLTGVNALTGVPKAVNEPMEAEVIMPRYLKAGDTIGITSPAGYITVEDIGPAIAQMQAWGLKIRIGNTIGRRDFGYGGTDEERLKDLQVMLDDPNIRAIMCARGGYGIVRIVDQLDFSQFVNHPKWIIGFSDITVLHAHINRNYGVASIHSKMCNSFPDFWDSAESLQQETILSIRRALTGPKMEYLFNSCSGNKKGEATGVLVGGNLKTLETLSGTKSDLYTHGKILFVEDTGEYLYSIDRMFWNLRRTGKLDGLKGLIIGGFKIKPDDPGEEFGKTVMEIVLEKIKKKDFPVCFDFPVGHQRNNFALKCGVRHRLEVKDSGCLLKEL